MNLHSPKKPLTRSREAGPGGCGRGGDGGKGVICSNAGGRTTSFPQDTAFQTVSVSPRPGLALMTGDRGHGNERSLKITESRGPSRSSIQPKGLKGRKGTGAPAPGARGKVAVGARRGGGHARGQAELLLPLFAVTVTPVDGGAGPGTSDPSHGLLGLVGPPREKPL